MTEFEKQIYNTWLAVTRSGVGKPFKLRKKWEDFDKKPEYGQVRRLVRLFAKFPGINISDFFKSPLMVYPEPYEYDLRFYTTPKALKCYRIYKMKISSTTTKEFMDSLKTSK